MVNARDTAQGSVEVFGNLAERHSFATIPIAAAWILHI